MDFTQVIKALAAGKSVRRKSWPQDAYISTSKVYTHTVNLKKRRVNVVGQVVWGYTARGHQHLFTFFLEDLQAEDWEVYGGNNGNT